MALVGILLCVTADRAWAQDAHEPAGEDGARSESHRALLPRYLLDIRAPEDTEQMLKRYLDAARWSAFSDLSHEQLHRLAEAIPQQARELLAAQGYFSPEIQLSLDDGAQPPKITLLVQPGLPVRVTQIDLQVRGPDGMPDAELSAELLKAWSLGQGAVFSSGSWETAKDNALLSLLIKRYPAAHIRNSEVRVDPAQYSAALTLALDTGPAYSFGPIRIEGLERYPEKVVLSQAPMHPGEPYDQGMILEYQQRLQNSQYFRSVYVSAPLADAQETALPVRVNVTEQPAQKIGLGLGYSSNTGNRGQIDYEHINLFGQAWRLNAAAKMESLQQSVATGLTFPRTAEGFRYSLSAELKESDIQGLTTRSQMLGGQRQRLKGNIETVTALTFINERLDVAGSGSTGNMALIPNVSWTLRSLDDPIEPTRGSLLNVRAGAAARALLSDQDFIRMLIQGVHYIALGASNQMILRGDVGSVLSASAEGIPQEELFRTGGIGSVRGYAYQSLGVAQGDAIVGARNLVVGSIELIHWFAQKWGAAAFYDRGGAADSVADLHTVAGYGIGARWRSPAGVISVDLAYGEAAEALRLQLNAGINF
jgi:translocation and assembly module TamA